MNTKYRLRHTSFMTLNIFSLSSDRVGVKMLEKARVAVYECSCGLNFYDVHCTTLARYKVVSEFLRRSLSPR